MFNAMNTKPIKSYDGYAVSDSGVVLSFRSPNGRGPLSSIPRILTARPVSKKIEYLRVGLYKDGVLHRNKTVHRLVAEAFIENPNGLPEINHINGIKTDNRAENLEWCSKKHNMHHSRKVLLRCVGERHGRSKLTELQAVNALTNRESSAVIAKQLGVHESTINRIRNRKGWTHLK